MNQKAISSLRARRQDIVIGPLETEVLSDYAGEEHTGATGLREQHNYTTLRLGHRKTKQDVRDLNGPRENGTGYNGHKSATCVHHRAPDAAPTHIVETMVIDGGFPRAARETHCSLCGDRLYDNETGV